MEFEILGPLVVRRDGSEVPIGAAKQRMLLTVLLLRRGEVVATETLVDELWSGRPPPTAVKAVQTYVSQLRKALGEDVVETQPAGYVVRLAAGTLDAERFEALLAQARRLLTEGDASAARELLEQALALWRGPPLAEFRYDDFARDEIGRLEKLRLVALEQRLEIDLALGRHLEAVPELEGLVARYPLRESLRELLMLGLYRAGRQADALAVYQDARRTLAGELGLEPGEPLRQLESAILRHDPSLDMAAPATTRAAVNRRRSSALAVFAVVAVATALALGFVVLHHGHGRPSLSIVDANAVGAVDVSNGHIVGAAPLDAAPNALAAGQDSIWATKSGADSVARIDPSADAVEQTIGVGRGPSAVAVGGGFVWVANGFSGTVSQIDPRANGGTEVARIGVGNGPSGIAYGLGGVWVANATDRTIVRIDPATGLPGKAIPVEDGADAIAVGDGAVWVVGETAGVLSRVDPATRAVTHVTDVGTEPDAVAAGPDAVWVANGGDGTVSRIDPATGDVKALVTVGDGPSGLAVAPGDAVWVTNALAGTLSRIDPTTDQPKTIAVGGLPQAVAIAAGTAFVAVKGAGTAHRGGTVRVAVSTPLGPNAPALPNSLDPARGYTAWALLSLTNDGLLTYGRLGGGESLKVVPDLATALPTVSDGGRTYTFPVRPGLQYSTGAPIELDDFRRGIERSLILDGKQSPGSYLTVIAGAAACVRKPTQCNLSQGIVSDPGSGTVTFHLTTPDPDFLYQLALPIADAVPAGTPIDAPLPLPATGPYEVASYRAKPGLVQLVRNRRFRLWSEVAQPAGFPDRIVERFGYTGPDAVRAVERGSADITDDGPLQTWPAALVADLRTRYSSRVFAAPDPTTLAAWLNTRIAPFDDVRVRRALNYAVDRRRLFELNGGPDVAAVSCQILPPNFEGYRRYCPYTLDPSSNGGYNGPDLAKARRLVAASGTKGQSISVWFYDIPIGRRDGGYLVSVLRELGYNARLRLVPTSTGLTWRPNRQIGVGGWEADYPAANDFFAPLFTCRSYTPREVSTTNMSEFCNRLIDAQVAQAGDLETTNPPAASRLWATIDREVTDQAPWVVLRTTLAPDFVSARTRNYTYCFVASESGLVNACLDQLWVR